MFRNKIFFVDTADVIAPYTYQRTNAEINKLIKWAKLCQRLSLDRTSPDIDVNFKNDKGKLFINSSCILSL